MAMNLDPRFFDDLAKRLSEAMPPQFAALRTDLENNFKSVLQAGLAKLDLVTRQEFDVQAGVLARTREKLVALGELRRDLRVVEERDPVRRSNARRRLLRLVAVPRRCHARRIAGGEAVVKRSDCTSALCVRNRAA